MRLTEQHKQAIQAYIEQLGGAIKLAASLDISPAAAYHIASGTCVAVRNATWEKLYPKIVPFLQMQEQHNREIEKLIIAEFPRLSDEALRDIYKYILTKTEGEN